MILRFLVLLLTLVWFSITMLAAEDGDENDTTTTSEENTEKPMNNSKTSGSKRAHIKTLEEFIPSEEISADRPVAFPNDI